MLVLPACLCRHRRFQEDNAMPTGTALARRVEEIRHLGRLTVPLGDLLRRVVFSSVAAVNVYHATDCQRCLMVPPTRPPGLDEVRIVRDRPIIAGRANVAVFWYPPIARLVTGIAVEVQITIIIGKLELTLEVRIEIGFVQ